MYVGVNVNPGANPNAIHPEQYVEAWRGFIDELYDRLRPLEDANRENRRIIAAPSRNAYPS